MQDLVATDLDGDGDLDLAYNGFGFEDDDDSGDFDPAFDSEIGSVETFSLVDGVQTIELVDGNSKVRLTPALSRTLYVAIVFETNAAVQNPYQIQITHLPTSSLIEDRDHDLPLTLEWAEGTPSGIVIPTNPGLIFADGFESGDDAAWAG